LRAAEKITRNVGILRRALTGKGSRSLVESVVEEAALLHEALPTTRDYWASLILDEEKAEVEYKRLADMMAPGGPIETATWVREIVWGIAEDEKRHAQQLKDMLESLSRERKIV